MHAHKTNRAGKDNMANVNRIKTVSQKIKQIINSTNETISHSSSSVAASSSSSS